MKHISFPKVKTEKRATTYTTASPMSNDKTAEEIERIKKAESYADSIDRRGTSYWAGLSKGYIDGSAQQLKEYREKLKEATELNKEAIALLDVIRMDMVDAGGNAWVVPQIEAIIKKLYPDYFDQTDSTK